LAAGNAAHCYSDWQGDVKLKYSFCIRRGVINIVKFTSEINVVQLQFMGGQHKTAFGCDQSRIELLSDLTYNE
jgi:hypothetical protein